MRTDESGRIAVISCFTQRKIHASEGPNDYFALVLILGITVSFYESFSWMLDQGSVGQTTSYHFGEEQRSLII